MYSLRKIGHINKIAVIGNYVPRQCGIATFTTDLCNALAAEVPGDEDIIAVAMDNIPKGYDYPSRVKFRIRENVQSDYFWAADFLNANQINIAILQHEYGIFGGEDGSYILHLIKSLQMPVLTNLHTVLENPTEGQKLIMRELVKYSDRLLVMSHKAVDLLIKAYGVDEDMIAFIPHGIPDVPFEDPGLYNDLFGVKDKEVILTFGLLNPGKGIENMIKAMPAIVEKNPDVVYIILGQTHPSIREIEGDSYRHGLQQLVNSLGLGEYIFFHNYFLKLETLVQYLQTSIVYAIPYLRKEQITSGTLAYALGAGTAVVSTPFWFAEELLAENRGRLVPFNDIQALAGEINNLLENKEERNAIRFKAYQYGRSMIWKEVARKHLNLIAEIKERKSLPKPWEKARKRYKILDELPEINLFHLKTLTDDTGIIQHAKFTVPNLHHGYCVDDNARALIVACIYRSLHKDKTIIPLLRRYLAFLYYAFNPENGRFRNFMSYDRRWLEIEGSEDSHGRALLGLGIAVNYVYNDATRNMAMLLFLDALRVVENFPSPRAWAFTIIGLQAYLRIYSGDTYARNLRTILAEKLFLLFKAKSSDDWLWCEDSLTYINAKLPHALILAGQWIPNREMFDMGIRSLEWLLKIQTAPEGHLSIIGNDGWYERKGQKAGFDQQPIEAMGLIEACLDTYIATKDKKWLQESERCLGWFLGRNDLQVKIYDFGTGGCHDGLESNGVNANQGAESTLAWLISLLRMYEIIGLDFE